MKKRKISENDYVDTTVQSDEEEDENIEEDDDEQFYEEEEYNEEMDDAPIVPQQPTPQFQADANLSHVQRAIQVMIDRASSKRKESVESLQAGDHSIIELYTTQKEQNAAIRTLFSVLSLVLSNGQISEFTQMGVTSNAQVLELMTREMQQVEQLANLYQRLSQFFMPTFYPELFPDDSEALNGTEYVKHGGQVAHHLFVYIDSTYTILKCHAMLH